MKLYLTITAAVVSGILVTALIAGLVYSASTYQERYERATFKAIADKLGR